MGVGYLRYARLMAWALLLLLFILAAAVVLAFPLALAFGLVGPSEVVAWVELAVLAAGPLDEAGRLKRRVEESVFGRPGEEDSSSRGGSRAD